MLLPHSAAALPGGILFAARATACNDVVGAVRVEESRDGRRGKGRIRGRIGRDGRAGGRFVVLVIETAAPEPQVGPEGRVPAWVEQEREAPTASRSAAAG